MVDVIFEFESGEYAETHAKLLDDPVIWAMAASIRGGSKTKSAFVIGDTDTPQHGFMLTALEKYKEFAADNGREPIGCHIGGPATAILALAFNSAYELKLGDLELTTRTSNRLEPEGIEDVAELVNYTEKDLLDIPNFGQKALDEVKAKLVELGVRLSPSVTVSLPERK